MDIKHDVKVWIGYIKLRTGTVGACEHGNKSSSCVKCWKYE
jgi:hypothetical protein